MLMLVLGAAMSAQDMPAAAPGPTGRFVICPGHLRCPTRPTRQDGILVPGILVGVLSNQYAGGGLPSGGTLRFRRGDAGLNAAARRLLDRLAARLPTAGPVEILLEGHADPDGSAAANVALAGRRAEAAADYLSERGVPAEQILAISWVEAAPEGLRESRSVVVTVRRPDTGR